MYLQAFFILPFPLWKPNSFFNITAFLGDVRGITCKNIRFLLLESMEV